MAISNTLRQETGASSGFPPVARGDARVLILGSLPGQRSLRAQQYYAHPQNAFWRIMCELVGVDGTYAQRCEALIEHRIALWDVLASAVRLGSMDADIRRDSLQVNDFKRFLSSHTAIERIGFNGRKAAQLFATHVQDPCRCDAIDRVILPSTSPAYASMSYADKFAKWRSIVM